jgi:hypothetical protein
MSAQILLNDTYVQSPSGSAGPQLVRAGETVSDVPTQTALLAAGGILWPASDPFMAAQQVYILKLRSKGWDERISTEAAIASAIGALNQLQEIQVPQATSATALTEVAIIHMIGTGVITAAYYLPNANSAPAAGSNSQAITLNIYNALGVLVGALATATLNNANQMTKWVRFTLGTVTNGTFSDGYTVTASTVLTGTATLPAGQWVLVLC